MRFFRALRLIALVYIAFMLGLAFTLAEYPKVKGVQAAVKVIYGLRHMTGTGDWFPERTRGSGVLRNDTARTFPGYTLYNVAALLTTELVDMDGNVVWRWYLPPEELFEKDPTTLFGLMKPHIDASVLYPNGDLLVIYAQPRMGTYGGPLVRLDKDSKVLWRADITAHHAVKPVGDKIYTLTQHLKVDPIPGIPSLGETPYMDDMVTVLDDRGSFISAHSILRALANAPGLDLVATIPFNERGDPLHANDIEVLTEETARHFPGARPGNVIVSLKHPGMLVVLDLEKEQAVWAMRGSWAQQHDVDPMPDGRFLLFDNEGGLGEGSRSRVLEIEGRSGAVVWSYQGSPKEPFFSETRGGQQRLPNGNTIISESTGGRILEVARDGAVVWEYVLPQRAVEDGRTLVPAIGLATERYDPAYPAFLKETRR